MSVASAVFIALAFSSITLAAAEPVFTPILPDLESAGILAVSEGGTILGLFYDRSIQNSRYFILKPSGAFSSFGPLYVNRIALAFKGIDDHGNTIGVNFTEPFWRQPDGTLNPIQHPGARYTSVYGINNYGDIVGEYGRYLDGTDLLRFAGFIGFADGIYISDIPGSPIDINDNREVVGSFNPGAPARYQGYILSSRGDALFSVPPTPGVSTKTDTLPTAINNSGEVVGSWKNIYEGTTWPPPDLKPYESRGFYRAPDGKITIIDYPGAWETYLKGIDGSGRIVGTYRDRAGNGGSFSVLLK